MLIWIGVGAFGLVILVLAAARLLGRLGNLRHAMVKVQRRQAEAERLQTNAQQLEQTLLGLQSRAETMQERLAIIKAGHGDDTGKHAWPGRG